MAVHLLWEMKNSEDTSKQQKGSSEKSNHPSETNSDLIAKDSLSGRANVVDHL
jgi:hypothetical protein